MLKNKNRNAVIKLSPFRIIRVRVYALLLMLAFSTAAAAMYKWNGLSPQGNADNLAWAYNDTVTSSTANGSVYIGCRHGADYLRPS